MRYFELAELMQTDIANIGHEDLWKINIGSHIWFLVLCVLT